MKKRRHYRFQRYILPPLATYIGVPLLHCLFFTCRMRVTGLQYFLNSADRGGCFLALWHDSLLPLLNILYRQKHTHKYTYSAVMSKSRDAEVLAAIASSYPQGEAIRVPHNARHLAAAQMLRAIEDDKILLITPDGPRGPAHKVKSGTAFASIRTGAPILPLTWKASRYWTLPTWDKMRIPKPFSRIDVTIGEPIKPDNETSLEEVVQRLQASLDAGQ